MFLEAQLLVADDRNGVEKDTFSDKEIFRKATFERGGLREELVSREGGIFISLNLPTAVQSPRSKGDGRYDDDEFGIGKNWCYKFLLLKNKLH